MIFFFFLLLVSGISSVFVSFSKDSGVCLCAKVITFFILLLPLAFQYGVGADYVSYTNIFNAIAHGRNLYEDEAGWLYLNRLVFRLGGNAQMIFAVTDALILYFLFSEVSRKKWFVYVPVCVAVIYPWLFTTLRQMLAMSMVFCGVLKFQKKKYIRACALMLGSYFFHKSVLVYIPLYFIVSALKMRPRLAALILFCVCAVSYFFAGRLNAIFFAVIGISPKYALYLTTDWVNDTQAGMSRFARYIAYPAMLWFYPWEGTTKLLSALFCFCAIDVCALEIQIMNRIARGMLIIFMPIMYKVCVRKRLTLRLVVYVLGLFFMAYLRYATLQYVSVFSR